jgi:hypothetical protein
VQIPLRVGFPIRKSADQRLLASPRSLSQRATSFIASWRQGIHRTLLSRSSRTTHARTQDQAPRTSLCSPNFKCPATTTNHLFTPHPSQPAARAARQPRHVVTNHSDSPVKQHRHPARTPSEDLRRTAKPVVQRHVRAPSRERLSPLDPRGQTNTHSHPMETVGIEPTAPCLQSRCSTTELRPQKGLWWAKEDLNLRPHAYQACALTN